VGDHDDAADIVGDFISIWNPQEMTYHHDDEDAQASEGSVTMTAAMSA
jgi:hypothetical protein